MWSNLSQKIATGDVKSIARAITLVENEEDGYEGFLAELLQKDTPVIGITGPPGAGKSTLTDALIAAAVQEGKKIAVICVDPSSPFHLGALLGDRIRLSKWYTHEKVFIRSLASRGAMGGLHPKILEITELLKSAPFDIIIIETVGVGQSEIEIAGLADVTVVVLVPESGDAIQTMKAGLMEIADIFVVNKSDRPGAELFAKNLRQMLTFPASRLTLPASRLAPAFSKTKDEIPIIATAAHEMKGTAELYTGIQKKINEANTSDRKLWLLTEKAWQLIQKERMQNISKEAMKNEITQLLNDNNFNLYRFVSNKTH